MKYSAMDDKTEFTRMSLPPLERAFLFQVANLFSTLSISGCQSSLDSEVALVGSPRHVNRKDLITIENGGGPCSQFFTPTQVEDK